MMDRRAMLVAALALVIAACDGETTGPGVDTKPDTTEESNLTFLRPAPGAPALLEDSLSFWAVRGEDHEVFMYYEPAAGSGGDREFLRFRLDEGSLLQRPDGSTIAVGDSVEITIVVVDPERLIVEFRPSGLRFAPTEPARLKLKYAEADHDFDDDGDVDDDDVLLERTFSIWRQEQPGDPWVRIGTARQEELDEVEANLTGFTRYAIAF